MMASTTAPCCYCKSTSRPLQQKLLLCRPCATRLLASQIARHNIAKERRDLAREDCVRRLVETRPPPPRRRRRSPAVVAAAAANVEDDDGSSSSASSRGGGGALLPDPNQIHGQVSRLKRHLDELRSRSNDLAVRVAAKKMENDEREEGLMMNNERVRIARERLDRMRRCLLGDDHDDDDDDSTGGTDDGGDVGAAAGVGGGGLRDALHSGTREIQTLRFHFACRVFDMHRLDVGGQYSDKDDDRDRGGGGGGGGGGRKSLDDAAVFAKVGSRNEGATGVGKIGGLPLPHAGPVLYGVIPPAVLASSLRLVASLTQLVARCLGVVLPHPILVCFEECRKCGKMYDFDGDVIDVSNDLDVCDDDDDDDDGDGDNDDDDDDDDDCVCGACLNEGMSKNLPTKSPFQHPRLTPQSQERRRSSFLAIVGSSARKVVSLTTSATSRAITHMQQSSSISAGTTLPSDNHHNHAPPQNVSSYGNSNALSKVVGSTEAVSMSPDSISRRIHRAAFAYLRESHDRSATEYVLSPPRWRDEASGSGGGGGGGGGGDPKNGRGGDDADVGMRRPPTRMTFSEGEEFHVAEERFATGLQLLQNDIVALCFRAGVDVSTLWPAESVLLNLHSLWRHCRWMAEARNKY